MYDVITIGSATVDVFANTDSQLVKLLTKDGEEDFITYPSGSKILIKELNFLIGGGGTNTAASFSRLGLKTGFLGKLGTDQNGEEVIKVLKEYDVTFLGKKEGQTGYSIILDSIEHDRTILTFKGCNNTLKTKDVNLSFLQTKWIYSSSMVEESFNTLKTIFEYAKGQGIKLAFNPSAYQAKLGYNALREVLELLDVLVLNLEEAQLLLNKKDASAEELASALSTHDTDYVVITDGANGSTCYHNKIIYHISPSSTVKLVETTGAGDAFASGFVAGLIQNRCVEESLKLGCVQSESVISKHGAKNKLLTLKEAEEKMSVFDGKQTKKISEKEIREFTDPEKHLPSFSIAPEDKGFRLKNGKIIRSIEELAYFLKYAPEDLVLEHIGKDFNHFADWIEHVFGKESLAKLIREKEDKKSIVDCLLTSVKN
ncbi:carbohydrate kinase family protein [Candidatus Woesearchaeota archaeon]|nr:carbohydrate kinase family protein [Candidatus Woesearchaeota archaeon]